MLKRLRWLTFGYLLGATTSYLVAQRLRRVARRYAPPEVRDRVGGRVHAWRDDMRAAWVEGRAAMHARERELNDSSRPARRLRAEPALAEAATGA